jgi:two-component system response regulator VicR
MQLILLINEDPHCQEVIASLLRGGAYKVIRILGGKKGMEAVKTIHADLIISELMLSYKSGLEWISFIKEQHNSRNTPVFILSPITNGEMISDCLDMGVEEYFVMPFEPHEFIVKVSDLLLKQHVVS